MSNKFRSDSPEMQQRDRDMSSSVFREEWLPRFSSLPKYRSWKTVSQVYSDYIDLCWEDGCSGIDRESFMELMTDSLDFCRELGSVLIRAKGE
jgi:hypothetical protein